MRMAEQFNLEKEFPNYFQHVIKAFSSVNTDADKNLAAVEHLLCLNMQAILNRLNMAYLDKNGLPATQSFFNELIRMMQAELPEDANADDLEVYISGGVVRTLLAYIYKELHTHMQGAEQRRDVSARHHVKNGAELQIKSKYLHIRNSILSLYNLHGVEAFKLDDFFKQADIALAEKESIRLLSEYLKENREELTSDKITADTDNGFYAQYLASNARMTLQYSELWKAIDGAEYQLLRAYMMEQTPLAQAFVLGVGSDLDILYELKGELGKDESLKQKLKDVATNFINSAEHHFKLRDTQDSFKHSLVPIGDVKEYHSQISRVLDQGGSMLDALAFRVHNTSNQTHLISAKTFKDPVTNDGTPVLVMKNFIEGIYDYVENGDATQKQTVRGLRALLELPFLQLSAQGKAIITAELRKIEAGLQDGTLDPDAMKQVEKMIRNAHFSGAHNRAFRESDDAPLRIFADIVSKMTPDHTKKIRTAFPKFLEELGNRDTSGRYAKDVGSLLTKPDKFINDHTNKGILYHGTACENLLPILRGGFLISNHTQGMAVCGSGLYTTKDKSTANEYAGVDGFVLELNINKNRELRILDLGNNFPSKLLKQLDDEAKEKACDLNQLLREYYGIDIIINTHVIVQNLESLILPKDFSPIVRALAPNPNIELFHNGRSNFLPELIKYDSFYNLANLCGCDVENTPKPLDLLAAFFQGKNINEIFSQTNEHGTVLHEAAAHPVFLKAILERLPQAERLKAVNEMNK